jgi:hypothetical protein
MVDVTQLTGRFTQPLNTLNALLVITLLPLRACLRVPLLVVITQHRTPGLLLVVGK